MSDVKVLPPFDENSGTLIRHFELVYKIGNRNMNFDLFLTLASFLATTMHVISRCPAVMTSSVVDKMKKKNLSSRWFFRRM